MPSYTFSNKWAVGVVVVVADVVGCVCGRVGGPYVSGRKRCCLCCDCDQSFMFSTVQSCSLRRRPSLAVVQIGLIV